MFTSLHSKAKNHYSTSFHKKKHIVSRYFELKKSPPDTQAEK